MPHNRHLKRYRDGFRIAQEQAKRCDDDSDDEEKVSEMFLSRALDVRVRIKTWRPRDVRETTVEDGNVEEAQRGGRLGEIEHQHEGGGSRVYENREEGEAGGVSRPERTKRAGVEEESGRAERDEEEKEEEEERTREFEQQQQQQLERK